MDSRTKQRTLSREEEAELSRSKKKVKDVHHANFSEGINENGFSPRSNNAWVSPSKSFKEKLIGEILGAYAQAFVSMTKWRTMLNQTMRLLVYVKG